MCPDTVIWVRKLWDCVFGGLGIRTPFGLEGRGVADVPEKRCDAVSRRSDLLLHHLFSEIVQIQVC